MSECQLAYRKTLASRRFKYSPLSRCAGPPSRDAKGHEVLMLGVKWGHQRVVVLMINGFVSDNRVNDAFFYAPWFRLDEMFAHIATFRHVLCSFILIMYIL